MSDDEVDGSTNPLAESAYLSAAGKWLSTADRLRTSIVSTDPIDEPFEAGITARITKIRDISNFRFESAARLAELNIRMAAACGAYQDRQPRVEMKTGWLTDAVGDTMARVSETLKADDEAHQAETLRPGIDPEPPEDGALWTADGEYFAFAVFPLEREIQRWLIIKSYTQALKWHNDYPNNFITADTWEGLDGKIGYADDAPLRRPTAAERAAFYGPEPDPTATHINARRAYDPAIPSPPENGHGGSWLESLSNGELATISDQVRKLQRRRCSGPRIGGGAEQWREG